MLDIHITVQSEPDENAIPEPVVELLNWAYSKLHHYQFLKLNDALMLDRLKNFNEHGLV